MSRTALALGRASNLFFAVLLTSLLAACGGDDNNDTTSNNPIPDPVPQDPSGLLTRTATQLNVSVTGVTINSAPVVDFTVRNEFGDGFVGLPLANLNFTIAKLIPSANGNPSRWQNYINKSVNPGAGALPGATAQVQAGTDNKANGKLVDHGNGNYTYTFGTDIANVTSPVAVAYEPNLTHRLAIQISGGTLPVTNAVHTWQPSSGMTTGIYTRDIVKVESCNGCHDKLAFHGGGRVDTKYCVTCHNPGTTDPETGNTIDAKVLFHKLHRGANLPSVVAGGQYSIVGFGGAVHDYSNLMFPQDIRNCTKCHDAADPATPDAGNWMTQINRATCGSCHDNVDFNTGTGHPGGPVMNDTDCVFCHKENGLAKTVAQAHIIPQDQWAAKYKYNILGVTNTAPGQLPVITFSVTDPTNGNAAYDIKNASDPVFASSGLGFVIGWNTVDYSNEGSGVAGPARPITFTRAQALANSVNNGDNTFTFTAPTPIPAEATGTAVVAMQGYLAADYDGDGVYNEAAANVSIRPQVEERVPVTSVVTYSAITDATAQPRRQVVAIDKCDKCHQRLSLHGGNRNDQPQLCVVCHNPNDTDKPQRDTALADPLKPDPTDGKAEESIDFKRMIHGIHSANAIRSSTGLKLREKGLEIFGFGGTRFDFSDVRFPGKTQKCETCHLPGTYVLPMKATVLGSTINTGADIASPADDLNITPTAAVCSSCHDGMMATTHMEQNGASFETYQAQIDNGTFIETCVVCHGPGAIADVTVVHAKSAAAH